MGTNTGILTGWIATAAEDPQDHDQNVDLGDGVNPDEDPTDLED